MSFPHADSPNAWSILKRQLGASGAFGILLAIVLTSLYLQDRNREWTLRVEQAKHRLDVAGEIISHEMERIRADALFLADQTSLQQFADGQQGLRTQIEDDFVSFVQRKMTYDQLRLLDPEGRETIRINYHNRRGAAVPAELLQNKSDRYYYHESQSLQDGEVFVSDFDLNLEHGQIEQPLKPVIRFVVPVTRNTSDPRGYVVLNYLGAQLLRDLHDHTLPGYTLLLRSDGHFLRGLNDDDAWGWLLGHQQTFPRLFPIEWQRLDDFQTCRLTPRGAFAMRRIDLDQSYDQSQVAVERVPAVTRETGMAPRDSISLVSYVPRDQVFSASNQLLRRLLLLALCIFFPLTIFARYWAYASVTRQLQSRQIAISEERLRDLSSRLLRIQEEERRAISREIHDELGQQVTAISLDLKLAQRELPDGPAHAHLQCAIRENQELLETLHAFATRVRPAVLDDLGLHDALESHVWEFQKRTRIQTDATFAFDPRGVPRDVADNAYRLVQESLNNVAKHAHATHVTVSLTTVPGADGSAADMRPIADRAIGSSVEVSAPQQLLIVVHDNGCGYDSRDVDQDRLGLIGMQERVDLLHGALHVLSDPQHGTRVQIMLPLVVPNYLPFKEPYETHFN